MQKYLYRLSQAIYSGAVTTKPIKKNGDRNVTHKTISERAKNAIVVTGLGLTLTGNPTQAQDLSSKYKNPPKISTRSTDEAIPLTSDAKSLSELSKEMYEHLNGNYNGKIKTLVEGGAKWYVDLVVSMPEGKVAKLTFHFGERDKKTTYKKDAEKKGIFFDVRNLNSEPNNLYFKPDCVVIWVTVEEFPDMKSFKNRNISSGVQTSTYECYMSKDGEPIDDVLLLR